MIFSARPFCCALLVLGTWLLGGCVPSAQSQMDEEKEPHFLAGKSRLNTLDYSGAVESFEKALEANPHSAAAHFELGCLFAQQLPDPAAAIYHYEQYRRLRPGAANSELVSQRVTTCKQTLASDVSLGPVNGRVQRELEQLSEDKRRLTLANKDLQDKLDQLQAYANRLACLTNAAGAPGSPGYASPGTAPRSELFSTRPQAGSGGTNPVPGPIPASRTHAVKAGETPTLIAKKYGIKLDALMAANPKVDSRRLRVGQVLALPAS